MTVLATVMERHWSRALQYSLLLLLVTVRGYVFLDDAPHSIIDPRDWRSFPVHGEYLRASATAASLVFRTCLCLWASLGFKSGQVAMADQWACHRRLRPGFGSCSAGRSGPSGNAPADGAHRRSR